MASGRLSLGTAQLGLGLGLQGRALPPAKTRDEEALQGRAVAVVSLWGPLLLFL